MDSALGLNLTSDKNVTFLFSLRWFFTVTSIHIKFTFTLGPAKLVKRLVVASNVQSKG